MEKLTDARLNALHEAVEEGYQARHIQVLSCLDERYQLSISESTSVGKVECYASVQEACEAAVTAEIANGNYRSVYSKRGLRPDILRGLT